MSEKIRFEVGKNYKAKCGAQPHGVLFAGGTVAVLVGLDDGIERSAWQDNNLWEEIIPLKTLYVGILKFPSGALSTISSEDKEKFKESLKTFSHYGVIASTVINVKEGQFDV